MTDLAETVWEVPRNMRGAIESTFSLSQDAFDNPSPWTGERTPYGPFVQVFMAEITPPRFRSPGKARDDEADWRQWQGFITRLRGTSGKLRIVDYFRMRPAFDLRNPRIKQNWSDGSAWSDGSQWESGALPPFVTLDEPVREGATTAVLRGLPADTPEVLSPADLGEARPNGVPTAWGNLYETVHCARTNSAGKARIYFEPAARQNLAAGDMWVLRYPTTVFRLADKGQGIVKRSLGNVGNLSLKLIEEIRNV